MRITRVKKQQWSDEDQRLIPYTLVMLYLMSDMDIADKAMWFKEKFGDPGVFKIGRYWYCLIGGIAMDEQVFSWYSLQNEET